MADNRHQRETDNIYLNINVNNDNSDGSRKIAQFSAEYENPIIDNPSEFNLSVVKFQIPLDELPLFIIPVVPGQILTYGSGTPINTPFSVGLYQINNPVTIVPPLPAPPATTFFAQQVTWVPQWWDYPLPSGGGAVNLDNNKFSPIMYAYSYQSVLTRVNLALAAANTQARAVTGTISAISPYYILEDDKFKLVIPAVTADSGWSVFVNVNLLEVFQGFSYNISSDQLRYQLDISYLAQSNYFTVINKSSPPVAFNAYVIPQEYSNFEYLSSARKIVMTSNTIPARKEYYPVPANNVVNSSSVTGVTNGLGIISDFQLDLQNKPGEQRSIATYNSDLYRMVDLDSTHPMRKIDVNFFWADQFNNLFPLYISPFGNINVKLGFFRKSSAKVPNAEYDIMGQGRSVFH